MMFNLIKHMMIQRIVAFVVVLSSLPLAHGQSEAELSFQIEGLNPGDTVYLANYYGNKMYYADTALVASKGRLSYPCLLYTSPSPRDLSTSRMPSSA